MRHRSDKEVNLRKTYIINSEGEEVEVKSQSIHVSIANEVETLDLQKNVWFIR